MARFFVGQRVRIVRNVGFNHPVLNRLIGKTGVISSIDAVGCSSTGHSILLSGMSSPVFHPDDLEPIIPEGQQPVAIADLLSEFPSLSNALGVSA